MFHRYRISCFQTYNFSFLPGKIVDSFVEKSKFPEILSRQRISCFLTSKFTTHSGKIKDLFVETSKYEEI